MLALCTTLFCQWHPDRRLTIALPPRTTGHGIRKMHISRLPVNVPRHVCKGVHAIEGLLSCECQLDTASSRPFLCVSEDGDRMGDSGWLEVRM